MCTNFGMKHTLVDFDSVPFYCDNTSAINLSKDSIQHPRTKHIDAKHHFIGDLVLKGEISLNYISTKDQVAEISIKALHEDRFRCIRNKLRIVEFSFPHS